MLDPFLVYIKKNQLVGPKNTTLLAISGGVDSIVLAHLFQQADLHFAICHCHFGLRAQQADEDQAFVEQLAAKYKVAYYTKKFDTRLYAKQHKLSIQMAARQLRYTWFEVLMDQHRLDQVATAHHVSDEFETFLYNVVKGTNLNGLHGILPKRDRIIRPLGFAYKKQIVAYAKAENLTWREDSTNSSLKYQRNWLRHKVIPQLKKINPHLEKTFLTRLAKLRQVETALNLYSKQLKKAAFRYKEPYYYIDLEYLQSRKLPAIIVFDWLKNFGFSFNDLQRWYDHNPQSGKKLHTSTHWLLADRNYWIVGERQKLDTATYTLSSHERSIYTAQYTLQTSLLSYQNYKIPMESDVAALDFHKLSFPLHLRPWRIGDTFFPLGMSYRKKISDFLIDRKVPMHTKEKVYVLVSNNKIAWLVGYSIDDRFKLTNTTQQVYQVELSKKFEKKR